jgi:putative acetyltransferase
MIRKYNDTDLDKVMDIWQASTSIAHPFLNMTFSLKVAAAMREIYMPNPDAKTWVYERDGDIVGFVSMIGNEIGGLFVNPIYQSRGVGSTLVNHVRNIYGDLEVEVFERNHIGRSFYDKYGFAQSKHYFHEESQEEVLRLELSGDIPS